MFTKKSNDTAQESATVAKRDKQELTPEQIREKRWQTINNFYDKYKNYAKLTSGGADVFKEVKTFLERRVVTNPAARPSDDELRKMRRKLKDIESNGGIQIMVGDKAALKAAQAPIKPPHNVAAVVAANAFPKTYTVGDTHLVRVDEPWERVKTLAQSDAATVMLAVPWTRADIKQFNYGATSNVPAPADGLPDDLDVYQVIHTTDYYTVAVSVYTERAQITFDKHFAPTNDAGVRMHEGVPFAVYRAADADAPTETAQETADKQTPTDAQASETPTDTQDDAQTPETSPDTAAPDEAPQNAIDATTEPPVPDPADDNGAPKRKHKKKKR